MAGERSYTAGAFGIELAGKAAGYAKSVEGGQPFGDVVVEKVGPSAETAIRLDSRRAATRDRTAAR